MPPDQRTDAEPVAAADAPAPPIAPAPTPAGPGPDGLSPGGQAPKDWPVPPKGHPVRGLVRRLPLLALAPAAFIKKGAAGTGAGPVEA